MSNRNSVSLNLVEIHSSCDAACSEGKQVASKLSMQLRTLACQDRQSHNLFATAALGSTLTMSEAAELAQTENIAVIGLLALIVVVHGRFVMRRKTNTFPFFH